MMLDLPETITIWLESSNDGYGVKTYSRSTASARIAYKQEKFTDINGDQQISKAVCYSEADSFTNGAWVLFGESTSDDPDSEADDIRALSMTPSGTNLKKAWF